MKNVLKTILLIGLFITVCFSQNINISGIVTDSAGVALEGAVVMLEKHGYSDTTGVNGTFNLTGTVGIATHHNQSFSNHFSAYIKNNTLIINIKEKSDLEIFTFNIQGKVIFSAKKSVNSGRYSIALPQTGSGIYFHAIKTGKQKLLIRSNLTGNMSFGTVSSIKESQTTTTTNAARIQEQIDYTIKSIKPGYLNYRVGITNADTSGIDIKMISQDAGTVTDIDGNEYHAIRIGNQVWTVENLRTTKYNDGTPIPHVPDIAEWVACTSGTAAYCYYNNDSAANAEKYGVLYNWYTVNTGKLAPDSWHVPTDAEWDTLQNYLIANGYNWDGTTTGNKIAKSLAAKTDWNSSTTTGAVGNDLTKNNSTGFSALPGGGRTRNGDFGTQGYNGYWWSSTEYVASKAHLRHLYFNMFFLYRIDFSREYGFSVRLLRDN